MLCRRTALSSGVALEFPIFCHSNISLHFSPIKPELIPACHLQRSRLMPGAASSYHPMPRHIEDMSNIHACTFLTLHLFYDTSVPRLHNGVPGLSPVNASQWLTSKCKSLHQCAESSLLPSPRHKTCRIRPNQASQPHSGFLEDIPGYKNCKLPGPFSCCDGLRCSYLFRMLPPTATTQHAQHRDTALAHCFTTKLDTRPLPSTALATAHLPRITS